MGAAWARDGRQAAFAQRARAVACPQLSPAQQFSHMRNQPQSARSAAWCFWALSGQGGDSDWTGVRVAEQWRCWLPPQQRHTAEAAGHEPLRLHLAAQRYRSGRGLLISGATAWLRSGSADGTGRAACSPGAGLGLVAHRKVLMGRTARCARVLYIVDCKRPAGRLESL